MSEDEWDTVIDTNLKGTFSVTKAAIRPMVRQRFGRIISVSSVAGIVGNAGQANYSAAKAGMIGFTKAIAKEVASRNITANVIAPGFIDTEMTAGLTDAQRGEIMKHGRRRPHRHAGRRRAGRRLPRVRRGRVRHRPRADRRRRTGDVLMAANPRRKSRIAALQALYETDVSHHEPLAAARPPARGGRTSTEAQAAFARELVEGVIEHREAIDDVIRPGRAAVAGRPAERHRPEHPSSCDSGDPDE